MATSAVHTFQGGMVRDLDKSLIPKDHYLEAHNFRLVTSTGTNSTGETSGSLENIEGNKLISSSIPNTMSVAGSVYLRDTVVLFLTDNTTTTPSHVTGHNMIVSFTINTTSEALANYFVIYDDWVNNGAGTLGFSTANPIRAVAVYEAPNIQKIYWCDGYNNIRYANIVDYLTSDGLIKAGGNVYFTPDLFEFIPNVTLTTPTLDYIVSGNIHAGMVQYAFQYFTLHGAETSMSPLSNIIHLTNRDDYSAYSLNYWGEGDINSTAGKGVRIQIPVDNSYKYDNIRIIRLHYTTVNSVPTITVVGEVEINSMVASVSFTDTGNTSLGTITLDEFNIGGTELFSAVDLAVKDNRLFAANISKDEFTIGTWDSRAIRFRNSDNTATINDVLGGDLTITQPTSDTLAEWDAHGWSSYLEDHDGINYFNSPLHDGDAAYRYNRQMDGATFGAEGPNVQIGFQLDTMIIDNSNSWAHFYVGTESTSDNKSYTSFASPYLTGRRSWQRDETYRLYLVFFDAKGRSSAAKWVCDLRMPSLHDSGYEVLARLNDTVVETQALYPTVYLKSMPTGAVKAQLLRVQRTGQDRSILTQALVNPVNDDGLGVYRPKGVDNGVNNTGRIVKLMSPEINITANIGLGSGDYLEYVTHYTSNMVVESSVPRNVRKGRVSTLVPFTTDCKTNVDEVLYVAPPTASTDTFTLGGITCSNYDTTLHAFGGTGLFVHHENASWTAAGHVYTVANYRRDVHASQYGGQTYEDRNNNIAIPASEVFEGPGLVVAWNGDTFINYFEMLTHLYDLTKTITNTTNFTVYIPLESSINTELRHDKGMNKEITKPAVWNMQEVAGTWTNASSEIYVQPTSLYQYNTVYSQESNAKYYVNVPDTVSTQTVFDCMIRVSRSKLNSESQDSWTLFPVNDFLEVDSKHGPLTTIATVNDKLLFWQTDAFGVLSVNERALIQDGSGANLVLGTGGILDRYTYISDKVGAQNNRTVVSSQSGIYWVDTKSASAYRFSDSLVNLSKSKMVQSFGDVRLGFNSLTTTGMYSAYDPKYNNVLFTVYNTSANVGTTLCFDENIDAFTSFYDYYTHNYIPYKTGFLTTGDQITTPYNIYFHNSKVANRCYFYGSYVDSTIKVVFNESYGNTKVFDNLFFVSDVTTPDVTTNIPRDVLVYNNTFSALRCYNSFQNTDYCNLVYGNTAPAGSVSLQRDERDWTTIIPRNAVSPAYTSDPFIFDAANINKARKYRERMRDKFMVTDLKYTNTSNRKIVVPYVGVKFRVSPR